MSEQKTKTKKPAAKTEKVEKDNSVIIQITEILLKSKDGLTAQEVADQIKVTKLSDVRRLIRSAGTKAEKDGFTFSKVNPVDAGRVKRYNIEKK